MGMSNNVKPVWQLLKELWPQTNVYELMFKQQVKFGRLGEPMTPAQLAEYDALVARHKAEDEANRAEWAGTLCFEAKAADFWLQHPEVHIERDRYGGCYSHGSWVAWPVCPGHEPGEAMGGDNEAMGFWEWARGAGACVGVGQTPDEALSDLETKVEARIK
jgi:hypothetical protein